ncbi:hypothetical protein MRB53_037716 [Persea americana]|nr:hypothetical protein MRB53_037716 [Persea americana]
MLGLVALAAAAPKCDDNIQLSVSASALNLIIPETINSSSILNLSTVALQTLVNTLPTHNITAGYTIAGRYCAPEVYNASRAETVQLLVHGVGYDRNYWSGKGVPGSAQQVNGTEYSWVDYASQQGYPTFSIDRLCNGQSSHIVGLECQTTINSATLHDVVRQLRAGVVGGKAFKKVVMVGHSEGSVIANVHAQQYPADVDSYMLTGFSDRFANGAVSVLGLFLPVPAAAVFPAKYGTLDPSYTVGGSRSGYEAAFYFGKYSEDLVDLDFANRGAVPLGEVLTSLLGQLPAPSFTGPVFVLTGQEDQVFCARGEVNGLLGQSADCGSGSTSAGAETQRLYPGSTRYAYYHVLQNGHDTNFHTTARSSFKVAHDFINSIV